MIFGLAINLEEQTSTGVRQGVQAVILAGTVLVFALLGMPLLRQACAELRRGRITIESLFLLTMAGAMFASLQSFISGRGPIYFEVISVLLVVYALGKAISAHTRSAARSAADRWAGTISSCRLLDDNGQSHTVAVSSVKLGDSVEVRPGELFAVDGIISTGTGFVSEAPVTGEPFDLVRRPGDRVLAGMASQDATFRVRATAPGSAREIDRLLETVERARTTPTKLQAQTDRLGRIFFPLLVAVSAVTLVGWTVAADWRVGLFNALSVLLVACPCALGLATPVVLWATLNRLAEYGLIAHSGQIVERLAQVDCIYFDKTGTLTEERFALVDLVTEGTLKIGRN